MPNKYNPSAFCLFMTLPKFLVTSRWDLGDIQETYFVEIQSRVPDTVISDGTGTTNREYRSKFIKHSWLGLCNHAAGSRSDHQENLNLRFSQGAWKKKLESRKVKKMETSHYKETQRKHQLRYVGEFIHPPRTRRLKLVRPQPKHLWLWPRINTRTYVVWPLRLGAA